MARYSLLRTALDPLLAVAGPSGLAQLRAFQSAKAKGEDVSAVMAEVAAFGDELKASEIELDELRGQIEAIALGLPNLPDASVPLGSDESQNVEQKTWGTPKKPLCDGFTIFEFQQLDLSVMDFSEVVAEFTDAAKLPDEIATSTMIQQRIRDYYETKKPK